jgi:hypothetical protein
MRQTQARAFAGLMMMLAWLPGALAGAEATHPCSSIASDAERLACYDSAFGRSTPPSPQAGGATNAAPAAPAVTASPSEDAAGSTATASGVPGTAAGDDAAAKSREEFGLSEADKRARQPAEDLGPASITSILSAVSSRPTGELVLTLSDGQVWTQVQTDARFRARQGDSVTIRKASLGSYLMVGPDRIATRVRRVK